MTRISLASIVLAAALAPLAACVDNNADSGMLILRNLQPGDGCSLDPADDLFISSGRIESNSRIGYLFTPEIRNDLSIVQGEALGPKTVFLEGARVELDFYDSALFSETELTAMRESGLTRFSVPTSGTLEPGGGSAALNFTIVPPQLLAAINARLTPTADNAYPSTIIDARVRVYGSRGGGELESNSFRYPVEVCRGCLSIDRGACMALPTGFSPRAGGACNPLQDGIVDCCDNFTVCPAVSTSPT